MNGSRSPAGPSGFSLETDDRTEEERAQGKAPRKKRLASALCMSSTEDPMDTDYQEEMEKAKPKIKFNLNFDKGISGVEEGEEGRFDIKRLFAAASSGDVMELDGLHQYLHRSMKLLSNTEYQSHGKNALIKALLNLRDGKNNTVKFLLDISEKMGDVKEFVNGAYTNSYYKGQTALHVAIERRSSSYVQLLLSRGANVHAKACGKFFQPHHGPSFYFGELPLSLAACTNQPDLVDFLMENEHQRADVREQDSHGNTVLHALVVVGDNTQENTDFVSTMYDQILTNAARLHPKWKLEDIENKQGLTPLKLAAKTGKIGIFRHILNRGFTESHTKHLSRKFTEWVYGPVHSSLYDLASLDSYQDQSVLEILVYGSGIPVWRASTGNWQGTQLQKIENRHEMLESQPLSRLLEEKWERFARSIFFFNFLVYLCYLCVFTAIAYNKREGEPPFPLDHSVEGYLYHSGQLLVALASCYFFIRGIIDMKRKRPKLETLLVDGYCEILFFLQASLFLASAALYCCGRQEYLGFLVLSLALSWINLLYFFRGYEHLGIYSVMIQKMILGDIMRFLFVYFVFLFGFSAAVVTLLIEPPVTNTTGQQGRQGSSPGLYGPLSPAEAEDCKKPTFRNISYTTLELFKFTIGMGDLEFTERYQYKEVFYILLISYIILTYILLLNMLIALMSRTVETTSAESSSIWKLQRALTILDLEKWLPCCLRQSLRSGVEKDLGSAGGEDLRWCFRVLDKNWTKWNINLGIINEDPGSGDGFRPTAGGPPAQRAGTWRGFLRHVTQRRRRPRTGPGREPSHQMTPLCSSPV